MTIVDETVKEEADTEVEDQVDGAGDAEGGEFPAEGEAQDQITVAIGEDAAAQAEEQKAPGWVKDLRKKNREQERELRELRRKMNEAGAPKETAVGEKPTLESFEYDAAKYEAALEGYYERKRKADEAAAAKEAEAKTAEQKWKARLDAFNQAKTGLGVEDFEDAEAVALDILDTVQQGIIVHGCKDSALVIYALGKNEEKARALAAIKDPVEFAFAVARLEGQMKVTGKKPAIAPESRISGTGRPSGTVDSTLERLRKEAEKSGDYSKVVAYKKDHKK